ncbi:alpha/beta fold hydrolase [Pseudonocardia ailaonensis]|uniref:Alpha/beta fold hydrolase n=1 Tax=Pseudonocardia ailaonensis TaxID=367279 RepID=A0ABN2N6G3_9PSEU
MPLVPLNGVRLHLDVTGPDDGPLAVLVMGTGSRGRVWNLHQVPALVRAGYRVATFDNRGIAPSDECATGFTIDDMVADTAAVIEHLGGGPAAVIGTSLGARITQELALARPDLVRCAVALAAHARIDPVGRTLSAGERALHDAGTSLPATYQAAIAAHLNLSPATMRNEVAVQDWLDLFEMGGPGVTPGVRAQLALSENVDRRAAYAAIRVPVLAVGFADDRLIAPWLAAEVAAIVPGARHGEIPDCGHVGYLERPDAVNAVILEFLAGAAQPDAVQAAHSRA